MSTPSIIINPTVGLSMSELEVQARKGCPFAQEQLQKEALAAAGVFKKALAGGLTTDQVHREFLTKRFNEVR